VDLIRDRSDAIAWWRSKPDGGIYDAWNHALGHARGEYICFLGADDAWLDAGALRRVTSQIAAAEYDLVTTRAVSVDPKTARRWLTGNAWDYDRIGRRMVVCHPGLMHRRKLFDEYGQFDASYRIAGDLDFLLRLPRGIRTLHIEAPSVLIEAAGVSQRNVLLRLREQREALARCPRYGPFRANLVWLDKLWRYPVARLLHIAH
jgi:glycosyltransferase involved in cell wall biosynthesis